MYKTIYCNICKKYSRRITDLQLMPNVRQIVYECGYCEIFKYDTYLGNNYDIHKKNRKNGPNN